MTTVGNIVDRIFRDYVDNPADMQLQVKLASQLAQGATTCTYANEDLAQEEIAAMAVGTVVEWDLELGRITAHDTSSRQLTVTRNLYDSGDVDHDASTLMRIAPSVPRRMIFDAVSDEIVSLSDDLYAVATDWAPASDTLFPLPAEHNPIDILSAVQIVDGEPVDVAARIARTEDGFSTGVGIYYEAVAHSGRDVFFRYTRGFARPASEDATLADLGVDESWVRAIIFGALSTVLVRPELDAVTQEFITDALSQQGYPVGSGTDVTVALNRLRELEVNKASDRLRVRDGARQSFNTGLHQVI